MFVNRQWNEDARQGAEEYRELAFYVPTTLC